MFYLIFAAVLWSFSFGLIKSELAHLDPVLVALIRLSLSFLVFLPFLRKTGPARARCLLGIGAVQFGFMYVLYIYSYRFLEGHQVALLTVTTPIFVVLFDAVFQKKWRWRYWLGAALALIGAAVLLEPGDHMAPRLAGLLLIQGANLCFALGQVLYKQNVAETEPMIDHFAWLYLGGLLVPLIFSGPGLMRALPQPFGINQIGSLLYLGLIPSGLGFFLWNRGVLLVNSGLAAVLNNLKIPLGAAVAWLVFREEPDPKRFFLSMIIMALALTITLRNKTSSPQENPIA